MSELRVALVAEGKTDAIVIEAALKALLPRPFVLAPLQPEPTRPKLGDGWGGVLRWCLEFAKRGYAQFEDDPTMAGFDLFVVHIDADVAEADYRNVSAELAEAAMIRGWPQLPAGLPCPPATSGAGRMQACLLTWAGLRGLGPRTVLCIPSKAIEAWLVAAVFADGHALLRDLECNTELGQRLSMLPMAERIRKSPREYRSRANAVTSEWATVRGRCMQAERFSADVVQATA